MHTHLTQVSEEYARMDLEEIRLLKVRTLPERSSCQRTAFCASINKDYKALVKEEEDPSEDSSEEYQVLGVVIFRCKIARFLILSSGEFCV